MSSGMPSESQSPGPVLAGLSFNDTVKGAASLTARVALYPSLLYNLARSQLQDSWHWFDKVTENVILGALPFGSMLETFQDKGIKAVVTLNEDFEVFISTRQYQEIGIDHLHIPTVDYLYAPPVEDLHRGVAFIAEHAERGELTYVHCKAGRGRSTTLVICYLIRQMRMSPEEAYAFVRTKRPQVCLAEGQWAAVREFHRSCLEARVADPGVWSACTDKLAEPKAAEQPVNELIDISGRRSPAGHARSVSASDSSGASETCTATLPVDPLAGIPRVDSPSCVSSHPVHSSSEGNRAPDQGVPLALPEPMVITVEANSVKGREGDVPVLHMASDPSQGPTSACGTQDLDIAEIHQRSQATRPAVGSSGQIGQDQVHHRQASGQQAGCSGQAEEPSCGIADRLRAAVTSRGFEPCPLSSDDVASCGAKPDSQVELPTAHDSAAPEQRSEQGHGTAMLCHPESEAGQQQAPSTSKGQERTGRLCQRDLHDLEREEAQQSASKKRRADISSFSIAAQLSCDDLSRAGTETEGAIDDQLRSRSDASEAGVEGMELEREDSRFHEWAAIDRNGSVISLPR